MKRLAVLLLAACGGSPAAQHPTTAPASDPTCPVEVPGTSVTADDTATGATLVFVTTGDVAAVRQRAKALADMHTRHDGPEAAMGMMITTSSTAVDRDSDNGATITFTVTKPDELAELQAELRNHAHHLATGTCKMIM